MLPFEDRYSRQRRLAEVGPEGQLRLLSARVLLSAHPDADIEKDYLVRAGVTPLELDPEATTPSFPWTSFFEFAAPLGVARGAWCALYQIRTALAADPR